MSSKTNCIVIIPTYNEKDNIKDILTAVLNLPVDIDVLIIDDNSPDGTASIVKDMMAQNPNRIYFIERPGKLGLGTAYITGFKWAIEHGYGYICEMDADFSHNPNDLTRLYQKCQENGVDMVVGSRYKSGVNVINWPIGRVLMSYYASAYVRLITGMKIMDTTAGFKCYSKKVLSSINLDKIKFKGYAFQIEMKFTVWKMGFHIEEIPIIFTDRKKGNSKMSGGIFNEALWGVLKMKIRSFFINYKTLKN